MAGTLGAITRSLPLAGNLILTAHKPYLHLQFHPFRLSTTINGSSKSFASAMAQTFNSNPETEEPTLFSNATETKVPARGKALVPTDLSIAVPEGTYAFYSKGPVGVILFNYSDVDFEVKAGDRIAQLIIEKIKTPEVVEVDDLDSTVRGAGGFGSTGV
ncbi:hypothetical protein L1987_69463 [Smallanthus sonchifolius]|uniref:Uncharacterized protein n=1 Tax=Smallanthus sonchifolius TaxID=185202 RepID=A0ACB9B5A5_9ASTR|nr:hypothetical protein L1987_69463 [Smallanthus sonchifolius]